MIAAMTLRERRRVEPGTEDTIGLPHEVETISNCRSGCVAHFGKKVLYRRTQPSPKWASRY